MLAHHRVAIGFAWLSLTMSTCAAPPHAESRPVYGRDWWLSITDAERSGFIVGFLDCYGAEHAGPARFTTKSYDRYRDLVTNAFRRDSPRPGIAVAKVIELLGDKPGETAENPGGEPTTDPHSGNDGLYWMQMSVDTAGHDEQRGFVEGFLDCHSAADRDKSASFSKSADSYVALIDRWYRYDRNTGDIDGDRQPRPIADALLDQRDRVR